MIVDAAIAVGCALLGALAGYPLGRRFAHARPLALALMGCALVIVVAGVGAGLYAGDRTLAMVALGGGFGLFEGVRLASGGVFSALAHAKERTPGDDASGD